MYRLSRNPAVPQSTNLHMFPKHLARRLLVGTIVTKLLPSHKHTRGQVCETEIQSAKSGIKDFYPNNSKSWSEWSFTADCTERGHHQDNHRLTSLPTCSDEVSELPDVSWLASRVGMFGVCLYARC